MNVHSSPSLCLPESIQYVVHPKGGNNDELESKRSRANPDDQVPLGLKLRTLIFNLKRLLKAGRKKIHMRHGHQSGERIRRGFRQSGFEKTLIRHPRHQSRLVGRRQRYAGQGMDGDVRKYVGSKETHT